MKLRLVVAYDGTGFGGWQSQPDRNTIQDHLEAAFLAIAGESVTVHGAGRTDAGVHAVGQCAHAELASSALDPASWAAALNAHLPAAIRVMSTRSASPDFHARFSATGKLYRYTLWNAPVMPPLWNNRAWHVFHPLNATHLEAALALFVGSHDFAAFCAKRSHQPEDTHRAIHDIRIRRKGPHIEIDFRGSGFLYKMVRMLAAAAVRCATGRIDASELAKRLESGGPRWNHVAPACGLCLQRVFY
ncbi:MAG: tRNA pseudouridine(38-40) synthase TruA [Terrimicrobiaceae bacterium]|nr:tRNA pseudouridine(38-40) synthase TruA [Terrimicrobiaceae bacterium]